MLKNLRASLRESLMVQVRSQTQSNVNVFSASVNLLGLVRSENILKTVLKRFVPVFLLGICSGLHFC